MQKRMFSLLAALMVASLVLAACGAPAAPATEAAAPATEAPAADGMVIKIATQSPLSGDASVIGVDIKRGAELALDKLGGSLASMGFKLELAPFDDQANPDMGVANAKQIVSDPAILCVVGHYNSGVQIPSSEEYHNGGLANVSPANTNPKVTTRGYAEVNRLVGRDDVQGVVGADFAKDKGIKSVFIIHDKTAYGQGIAEFFKQQAEKDGIQVLGFEGTEEKANFDSLLTPLISANPDMLYFGGLYPQGAVLFKQAREKGFMGLLMGPDGMDAPDLVGIGGASLLDGGGIYYSTVSGPASVYPGTAQFISDFKAKYTSDPQPFSAQAYDSAAICLAAIEQAAKDNGGKTPTREAVAKAIRALKDYAGITGTYTFNSIGDVTVAKYFVIQVKSADPAKWSDNAIVQTLDIAPPAP